MDSRWSWEDDHWQSSWWESWRVFEPGNWKNVPDIKFVEKILPILKEQAGSEILSSSYGEPNLSGPPRCSGICIANSSDTTLHSPNRANIVYIYIYIFFFAEQTPWWGTDSLSAAGQDDNTSEVSQYFYRAGVGTTAVERKLLRLELPGVQRAPVNLRLFQRAWNLFASQ